MDNKKLHSATDAIFPPGPAPVFGAKSARQTFESLLGINRKVDSLSLTEDTSADVIAKNFTKAWNSAPAQSYLARSLEIHSKASPIEEIRVIQWEGIKAAMKVGFVGPDADDLAAVLYAMTPGEKDPAKVRRAVLIFCEALKKTFPESTARINEIMGRRVFVERVGRQQ